MFGIAWYSQISIFTRFWYDLCFFTLSGCEVEEEYVVPVESGYIAIVAGVSSQLVTMVDGSGGVKPQDWLISWTGPRMRSLGSDQALVVDSWAIFKSSIPSISSISSTSSISSISWATIEWDYWMGFYVLLSNMLGLSQFMNEMRSERKDHLPKPKRIVEMVKKYRYQKSHLLPSHKSWIYHISHNSNPTKG